MGTPLLSSVPRVRLKREMATFRNTGPTNGTTSLRWSKAHRPQPVRKAHRKAMLSAAATAMPRRMWLLTAIAEAQDEQGERRHPPATEQALEHLFEPRHDISHEQE